VAHRFARLVELFADAEHHAALGDHCRVHLLRAAEQLQGADQSTWLARLDHEQSNLRAALAWGRERGDPPFSVRLAGALWRFWYMRGQYKEGQEQLSAALANAERELPGEKSIAQKEDSATRMPRAALARAYYGAGVLARTQGDFVAATRFLDRSLALYRRLEDKIGIANALNVAGIVAHDQGDYARAGVLYRESLAACREMGDQPGILLALNNLGNLAREQADYGAARALFAESLGLGRETGDRYGIALTLASMGTVAWYQQEYPAATRLLQEGLRLHYELGDQLGMLHCLETLGKVAAAQGQTERAARLWGAAAALREATGAPLPPADRADYERSVAVAREAAGRERFAAAWAAGRGESLAQIVEYAGREVA